VYVPGPKSTVNGYVVVVVNCGEHLSIEQLGLAITPSLSTSMMNVCGALSVLTRVKETLSPFVTVIVGPGLLPFQPMGNAPANLMG
jgi:hypothetical protein